MLDLNINNETGKLQAVFVGIANDFGGVPLQQDCYDPKSLQHVLSGTFPMEKDLCNENNDLVEILEKYNVQVFHPKNIVGINQIFARDIAFVIANTLVVSNVVSNRKEELKGLETLYKHINDKNIIFSPIEVRIEGGDVIIDNNYIFVGYSEKEDFEKYIVSRTNKEGVCFLQDIFPEKNVIGFELNKSDVDARKNSLHLDCCFQPIGNGKAILYKGGFKNIKDVDFLINYYGLENIIEINKEEMYNMNSNVFSISENVIVSEKSFVRLNELLKEHGFIVEKISYLETAKMEGLFRCSTMPLIRL